MSASLSEIKRILDGIQDPCSISAGAPLGLVEMGLIEDVRVLEEGAVIVRLRLTSPGCLMGPLVFEAAIREQVAELDGVRSVSVEYGDPFTWFENAISEDGRRRLADARNRRAKTMPLRSRVHVIRK